MAYNKYKLETLKQDLGLKVIKAEWIADELPKLTEDTLLLHTLAEAEKVFLGSEKARSEFIVAPVLQAFRRFNAQTLSIFSGYEFNVDKKLALNGYCDFILSKDANSLEMEAPAFFVVETKKLDIDNAAIAQCGAEMYAAMLFNKAANKELNAIYGCVTSGFSWGFLKLEGNVLMIDPNYVPLTFKNPYPVLQTLQWAFDKTS